MGILLFDSDADSARIWRNLAGGSSKAFEAESVWKGIQRIPDCTAIIVDQSVAPIDFVSTVVSLAKARPQQAIVATGSQLRVSQVVELMRGRVDVVFQKPLLEQHLTQEMPKILEAARKKSNEQSEYNKLDQLFSELTSREIDVLRFVLQGIPNKTAAEELNVSVRTIEARRAKIYTKTSSTSVVELVRKVDRLAQLGSFFDLEGRHADRFDPPAPEPLTPGPTTNPPYLENAEQTEHSRSFGSPTTLVQRSPVTDRI